jgi:hypothetical protein
MRDTVTSRTTAAGEAAAVVLEVTPEGFETPPETRGKSTQTSERIADCIAVDRELPRELAELVQAWPRLRREIRAAIMALLKVGLGR